MTARRGLGLALVTGMLVVASYQRPGALRVSLGLPEDAAVAEGFGGAGRTGGRPWRWTTAQSRVRLPAAGQVAPSGGRLRVEMGLPRWAAAHARRVTLAVDAVPLGAVGVGSGFAVHEFELPARGDGGDWVLSLATQGADRDGASVRGVALRNVELVAAPARPPARTLLLGILAAVALLGLLSLRLAARPAFLAVLAAALALASGLALERPATVRALPAVSAGLVLLLALDGARRGRLLPKAAEALRRPAARWIDWAAPLLGAGVLILPGVGRAAVPAFAVALGLVVAWLVRLEAGPGEEPETSRPHRHEAWIVAAVAAAGFAFRLYHLEGIPFSIFRDEARHGLLALRLLGDPTYRPLFVGPPINQPLPYFLAMAEAIRAFGVDLFALRIVSAVAGALAVPLLYLLVRAVSGRSAAAVAALLLAVSSWHVSISRFAVNYVEPSLFSLPAYLLLWWALPRARAFGLCLAALLVGLAQYTAHTAKPLLVVTLGLVVDEIARRVRVRDLRGLRTLTGVLALSAAVGLATLVPLLRYVQRSPDAYLARAEQVSLWTHAAADGETIPAAVASNLATYAGAFHVHGDRNGRHHLPGAPLLDPVSGIGLLAGLGLVLTGLGGRRERFLLLWLVAGLLPGILTVDAPSALRTVEAAPAVYAVAALGLVELWRRASGTAGTAGRRAGALLLCAAVAWNAWTYFVRMYDSPTVWRRFAPIATQLGKRLQALRVAGALPSKVALAAPRLFLDAPDTSYVLQLYWPAGLTTVALEDVPDPVPRDMAVVIPNERDYWSLVVAEEPRYTRNAAEAADAQPRWRARIPPARRALVGPPFPATDRPTYWLYLGGGGASVE